MQPFWTVNFGNVLTICLVLIALFGLHQSNVQKIKTNTIELQDIKNKVNRMDKWLDDNNGVAEKLNLMYSWFENNVVGRGESPRASYSREKES